MKVNDGIDGVIGGRPCIGDTGAGGYMPMLGLGRVIRPGAARVVDEDVVVVEFCAFEDADEAFVGFDVAD